MIDAQVLEIDISSLAKSIRLSPYILATRSRGAKFLSALLENICKDPKPVTILNFSGVELIDASFADQVFGALAAKYSLEGNFGTGILIRKISDDNLDNISMALETRPRREAGLRNCVLCYEDFFGTLHLTGKAEGHVIQTFALLEDHRQLSARKLADLLGLELAAASTRLKVLYDLGAALRTEVRNDEGRQYIYRTLLDGLS